MKHVLCAFLLFALPALATISQRQSPVSQFNSSASSTCSATLGSGYVAGDLIVVWTYWTTTGTNNLTASVGDSYLNGTGFPPVYPSAVGPTVQSAASSPVAAQIFYAKKTLSGIGGDLVTVTYSGSATTSGCVIVEYQGADQSYPLDSVSAGYGYSTGTLLDSGTAAPANANLLVFGGGTTDAANLVNMSPGSSFTSIVANFTSITEQYITTSPNNTLQRANALSSASGNWVMQMAVFRDASWTVTEGWSPVRLPQSISVAQYPGSDLCVQAVNAESALGGGEIVLTPPPGTGTPASCTVDMSSGFLGNNTGTLQIVPSGNNGGGIQTDVPIILFPSNKKLVGPSGTRTSITIYASANFNTNYASKRIFSNTVFAITDLSTSGAAQGCYSFTYTSSTPGYQAVIRGSEPDIQFVNFSTAQLDVPRRTLAGDAATSDSSGDSFCNVTGKNHATGPTGTAFGFF